MTPSTLLIAVLAAVLGALLAWLAGRAATERQRANAAAAEAGAAAQAQAAAVREQELSVARSAGEQLRAQLATAQSETAVLRITLDKEREAAADKLKLLQQTGEEMTLRFKQLSQEILEDKSRRFTEQNQLNIEQILKPLREKIAGCELQVKQSYELETRDRVALKEQIAQLARLNQQVSAEANNLAGALRGQARTQGAWGELVLERILEAVGPWRRAARVRNGSSPPATKAGQRYRPDVGGCAPCRAKPRHHHRRQGLALSAHRYARFGEGRWSEDRARSCCSARASASLRQPHPRARRQGLRVARRHPLARFRADVRAQRRRPTSRRRGCAPPRGCTRRR